jgi:hypothetical protein
VITVVKGERQGLQITPWEARNAGLLWPFWLWPECDRLGGSILYLACALVAALLVVPLLAFGFPPGLALAAVFIAYLAVMP